MGSQKQHAFMASPLKFNDRVVADMVRLPGVLLSHLPLTRDEVELSAHIPVAVGLLLVVRGHDELVEQMLHRVALSKLVISLLPPGLQ